MMNRVQPIYDMTIKMDEILDGDIDSKNRLTVIEEINSLLEERGILIENTKEPFTLEEKELGKKLLPLNQKIQQKMIRIQTELKSEMKQVKKQKSSNLKYTNPYSHVQTIDGMFLDKRK